MKIINVASSDNFEDILEAVKEADSSSIILVVPKSNRVFKSKSKIQQLKNSFDKLAKEVSIVSSGAVIEKVKTAGFGTIKEKPKSNKKFEPKKVEIIEADRDKEFESFYSEYESIQEPKAEPEKKPEDFKKFTLIFLSTAIVFFLFFVFTSFERAKIIITPKKNSFSIEIPANVSKTINEPDSIYSMIPGQAVEFEKTVTNTFASGGEKEVFHKAEGKLFIYNNFGTSPQPLVATTRFQTPEGLIFRIPQTITVPGAQQTADGLKPGEIEVKVVADRAGASYNIEPTTFTIPGFLGGPKYQGFYAKSFEKFSAGFVGKAKVVTKDDLNKAEDLLKNELRLQIKKELANLGELKILEDVLNIEIERSADSAKSGDAANEFKLGLKAKVKTIAFKEDDAVRLVLSYIKNSQNRLVPKNGLNIAYLEPKFDLEKEQIVLKLAAEGWAIEDLDREKILSNILGRKEREISAYLNGLKEVESARIFLSPFWLRSLPKDRTKVELNIIKE